MSLVFPGFSGRLRRVKIRTAIKEVVNHQVDIDEKKQARLLIYLGLCWVTLLYSLDQLIVPLPFRGLPAIWTDYPVKLGIYRFICWLLLSRSDIWKLSDISVAEIFIFWALSFSLPVHFSQALTKHDPVDFLSEASGDWRGAMSVNTVAIIGYFSSEGRGNGRGLNQACMVWPL